MLVLKSFCIQFILNVSCKYSFPLFNFFQVKLHVQLWTRTYANSYGLYFFFFAFYEFVTAMSYQFCASEQRVSWQSSRHPAYYICRHFSKYILVFWSDFVWFILNVVAACHSSFINLDHKTLLKEIPAQFLATTLNDQLGQIKLYSQPKQCILFKMCM